MSTMVKSDMRVRGQDNVYNAMEERISPSYDLTTAEQYKNCNLNYALVELSKVRPNSEAIPYSLHAQCSANKF